MRHSRAPLEPFFLPRVAGWEGPARRPFRRRQVTCAGAWGTDFQKSGS